MPTTMQHPETSKEQNTYGRPTLKRLGPLSRFTLGGPTGDAEPAMGNVGTKKSATAARQ